MFEKYNGCFYIKGAGLLTLELRYNPINFVAYGFKQVNRFLKKDYKRCLN